MNLLWILLNDKEWTWTCSEFYLMIKNEHEPAGVSVNVLSASPWCTPTTTAGCSPAAKVYRSLLLSPTPRKQPRIFSSIWNLVSWEFKLFFTNFDFTDKEKFSFRSLSINKLKRTVNGISKDPSFTEGHVQFTTNIFYLKPCWIRTVSFNVSLAKERLFGVWLANLLDVFKSNTFLNFLLLIKNINF